MKSFARELTRVSADWVSAGLIDATQRENILARHPVTAGAGLGRFITILAMIGGALVGAGIILLISANWEDIGDWTKIGALAALLVTGYRAGWWLKISPGRYPKTGDAVLMLSGLIFLGGIGLVSQIFHLNARPATGVLVWSLGIAAVPWLTRSKGAMFLSLVAWLAWLGFEFAAPGGLLELAPGRYHDLEIFYWWSLYGVLGMALCLTGLALRPGSWKLFAGTFETWGLVLLSCCLYALGYYRHAFSWRNPDFALANPLALGLVAGLLVIAGLLALRNASAETKSLGPWLLAGLVPVTGILCNLDLGDAGWLWSALAWALLFVLNLGMIRAGLREGRETWVNLALGFIALNIVTRYFDLFGTMLQGGVFFVVTGAVVIALGVGLEKQRRALLACLHPLEAL